MAKAVPGLHQRDDFLILARTFTELLGSDPKFRDAMHSGYENLTKVTVQDITEEKLGTPKKRRLRGSPFRKEPIDGNESETRGPFQNSIATPLFSVESPVSDFVDRPPMDSLRKLMAQKDPFRVALFGNTGCGKTEIARKLALEFRSRFSGVCEVNLSEACRSPSGLVSTLVSFIRKFSINHNNESNSPSELRKTFLEKLHDKNVLLILDNGSNPEAVKLFFPPLACSVLLTSRERHVLPGFTSMDVPVLNVSIAVEMVNRILSPLEEGSFSDNVQVASACGWNPFAIRHKATEIAKWDRRGCYAARDLPNFVEMAEPVRRSFDLRYTQLGDDDRRVWRAVTVFTPHFNLQDAREVLTSLGLPNNVHASLETLRQSSRITPFVDVYDVRNSNYAPAPLPPPERAHYWVEPLEKRFLLQELRQTDDWKPLERLHSFFFRERLLYLDDRFRSNDERELMNQLLGYSQENIISAVEWAKANSDNQAERTAFEKYLCDKKTLNHINGRKKGQCRLTLADLINRDVTCARELLPWFPPMVDLVF